MRRIVLALSLVAALASCTSRPPEETFLEEAATALGATTLNTVEYSGAGLNHAYGQAYAPGGPWPAPRPLSRSCSDYPSWMRRDAPRSC